MPSEVAYYLINVEKPAYVVLTDREVTIIAQWLNKYWGHKAVVLDQQANFFVIDYVWRQTVQHFGLHQYVVKGGLSCP